MKSSSRVSQAATNVTSENGSAPFYTHTQTHTNGLRRRYDPVTHCLSLGYDPERGVVMVRASSCNINFRKSVHLTSLPLAKIHKHPMAVKLSWLKSAYSWQLLRRAILTLKAGKSDLAIGARSELLSRCVHAKLQVPVCSSYNFLTSRQTHRQTVYWPAYTNSSATWAKSDAHISTDRQPNTTHCFCDWDNKRQIIVKTWSSSVMRWDEPVCHVVECSREQAKQSSVQQTTSTDSHRTDSKRTTKQRCLEEYSHLAAPADRPSKESCLDAISTNYRHVNNNDNWH